MGLRDRINLPRGPLAGSVLLAAAWLGLSLVFGNFTFVDLIVAAALIGGGVLRQRTRKPKPDDAKRGIYGPPS
jgi:hypothetical protein